MMGLSWAHETSMDFRGALMRLSRNFPGTLCFPRGFHDDPTGPP